MKKSKAKESSIESSNFHSYICTLSSVSSIFDKIDKTSTYPSVQRVERGERTNAAKISSPLCPNRADIHTYTHTRAHGKVKFHKGDGETSKRRGGNRVAFRVCRKCEEGGGEEASEFTLQKWWRIFTDGHLCDRPPTLVLSPRARLISNSLDATTTEFPLLRVERSEKT